MANDAYKILQRHRSLAPSAPCTTTDNVEIEETTGQAYAAGEYVSRRSCPSETASVPRTASWTTCSNRSPRTRPLSAREAQVGLFIPEHEVERYAMLDAGHRVIEKDQVLDLRAAGADAAREASRRPRRVRTTPTRRSRSSLPSSRCLPSRRLSSTASRFCRSRTTSEVSEFEVETAQSSSDAGVEMPPGPAGRPDAGEGRGRGPEKVDEATEKSAKRTAKSGQAGQLVHDREEGQPGRSHGCAGAIADRVKRDHPRDLGRPVQGHAVRRWPSSHRIDTKKEEIFGVVFPAAEDLYPLIVINYVAKLVAIELIPAGIDYWRSEPITVSATGTNENTTYSDPVVALQQLREDLLAETSREWELVKPLIDFPVSRAPAPADEHHRRRVPDSQPTGVPPSLPGHGSVMNFSSTLGLEEIQRPLFSCCSTTSTMRSPSVPARHDRQRSSLLRIWAESTSRSRSSRSCAENFYEGHRPSLIQAPVEKYPNISAGRSRTS
jgi:hypothetical protein